MVQHVSSSDPSVVALEAAMQAEYVEMYGETDQDPDNDYRGALDLLLLVDEDEPVGLLGWSLWPNGDGKVRLLYVVPERRGDHLADRLLHVAERAAHRIGVRVMRFETGPLQGPAQRLYERNGYTRMAEGFGFYAENPGSVFYAKVLL